MAVTHFLAETLFLYWRFWWLDLAMHMLGGVVIALGVYTLYDLRIVKSRSWLTLGKIVVIVFMMATLWEIYEYVMQVAQQADNYVVDTIWDYVMGLLGGCIGYFVSNNIRHLN